MRAQAEMRGTLEPTPHQLELKSSQMSQMTPFGEIYLGAERHKQQAFYIIQLWLHSDSQRWAVDYRGGGRRSFPPSSMWISPAPVNPPPPLAQSQRRSRGRRAEALRRLGAYVFHVRLRFRHRRQVVFHQDQVTQRMLASQTGDVSGVTGTGGHYRLQDQPGLGDGGRVRVAIYTARTMWLVFTDDKPIYATLTWWQHAIIA